MKWALVAVAVAFCGCSGQAPEQPLPFSHAVHVTRHAIKCVECHAGSERGSQAGLPGITVCLGCHMRPQGPNDDINDQVVRKRAAEGGEFRWVQVTRNPGHVYFSHRAHVTFAKMECATCHGDVSTLAEAHKTPQAELLSMDACMGCHRKRGVSNECITCHR